MNSRTIGCGTALCFVMAGCAPVHIVGPTQYQRESRAAEFTLEGFAAENGLSKEDEEKRENGKRCMEPTSPPEEFCG